MLEQEGVLRKKEEEEEQTLWKMGSDKDFLLPFHDAEARVHFPQEQSAFDGVAWRLTCISYFLTFPNNDGLPPSSCGPRSKPHPPSSR